MQNKTYNNKRVLQTYFSCTQILFFDISSDEKIYNSMSIFLRTTVSRYYIYLGKNVPFRMDTVNSIRYTSYVKCMV